MPLESQNRIVVPKEEIQATCQLYKSQGYTFLTTITAVCRENGMDLVYILDDWTNQRQILIATFLPEDQLQINSIIHIWRGADWLEREVYDMFGIQFIGHHNLNRILLEESCDYFPLRKSFKQVD